MPRIPDLNQHGIAFLFRTVEEATQRVQLGGTGFVVGVPVLEQEPGSGKYVWTPYLVSNAHVVFGGSACVASVNKRDGSGTDIFDIDQNDWIAHPTADIAAVSLFGYIDVLQHKVSFVPSTKFLTPDEMAAADVGVGDEVFMIGRFLNHQGTQINKPAVRFGSLSMMLDTLTIKGVTHPQSAFAVEMRSRTGFSGSPVSLYRTMATVLVDVPEAYKDFWRLLGVNAGYIIDEDGTNTWLNAVLPAWKIWELLDMPAFHKQREQEMAKVLKNAGKAQGALADGLTIEEVEPAGMTQAEIAARRGGVGTGGLATATTVYSKKAMD